MDIIPVVVIALFTLPASSIDVWYQDLVAAGDETPWGTLCVSGGQCRSFVHTALNVKPSTPLSTVFGTSEISLDGGTTWAPNRASVSESHLVFQNTTQVFTCNWDWLLANAEDPPSQVCIRGWFMEVINGESADFDAVCMDLNVTWVNRNPLPSISSFQPMLERSSDPVTLAISASESSWNSRGHGKQPQRTITSRTKLYFGNATAACSIASSLCDVMIHAALMALTERVVTPFTGSGEVSMDQGKTWLPQGEVSFLAYFDAQDDMIYQRWHFGSYQPKAVSLDELSSLDSEICYRVWFTDTLTSEAGYANMSSDVSSYSGYALDDITRCWPLSSITFIP